MLQGAVIRSSEKLVLWEHIMLRNLLVLVSFVCTLAACGGGGDAPPSAPPPLAITTQPTDVTVVAPNTATFSVIATGISYQWQSSPGGGAAFSNIAGATAATFTTTGTAPADTGKKFRVIVSGSGSSSITSSEVTLTVTPVAIAPSFTTQPQNVTVRAGQNAQLTVAVSGSPTPTLQWQLSTDSGTSWSDINGATGTTLGITSPSLANNGRQFRAVASNSVNIVNSNAATLTVSAVAQQTTLASATNTGGVPNNTSDTPTLSSNGRRIAFTSVGTDLVAGGAPLGSAYVRDLDASTTVLVNRTPAGGASSGGVGNFVKISGNGRYVIFTSAAPDLVTGDTNGGGDVFVRDLQTGTTVRVNVLPDGSQAVNEGTLSGTPVDISDDGRFVLFQSSLDLTGTGVSLPALRWFVRDLQGATTSAVTAFDSANGAVLSGDGQHVAVLDFAAGVYRVRVFDQVLGARTVLTIPASDGFTGGRPALSQDGRYVAFVFRSVTLLSGAAASANQIGVIDTQDTTPAATLELVSRTTAGLPGNTSSSNPRLSADGRYVVFLSTASSLTAGVAVGGGSAAVLRDRVANTTLPASRNVGGVAIIASCLGSAISSDGGTVAFCSDIADVLGVGTLGGAQIFVAPRP